MRYVSIMCLCVLLFAESLALLHDNSTREVEVSISCDDLLNTLQTFIRIRTDMLVTYDKTNCMSSSLMRTFVRETTAIVSLRESIGEPLDGAPASLSMIVRDNDPGITNMLVLGLIGRHYTAQFKTGQVFFEFDPTTQIVTANMPRCEYERSFFVLLLFVSIVLLVFSLVMQNLNAMPKVAMVRPVALQNEPSSTAVTDTSIPVAIPVQSRMSVGGFSLNFATGRRSASSVLPTSCGRQRISFDGIP